MTPLSPPIKQPRRIRGPAPCSLHCASLPEEPSPHPNAEAPAPRQAVLCPPSHPNSASLLLTVTHSPTLACPAFLTCMLPLLPAHSGPDNPQQLLFGRPRPQVIPEGDLGVPKEADLRGCHRVRTMCVRPASLAWPIPEEPSGLGPASRPPTARHSQGRTSRHKGQKAPGGGVRLEGRKQTQASLAWLWLMTLSPSAWRVHLKK